MSVSMLMPSFYFPSPKVTTYIELVAYEVPVEKSVGWIRLHLERVHLLDIDVQILIVFLL